MEKTSGWTKGNSSALVLAALCTMTVCGAAAVDPAEWITGSYVVPGEDDYAAHFADAPAPVRPSRSVKPLMVLEVAPCATYLQRVA